MGMRIFGLLVFLGLSSQTFASGDVVVILSEASMLPLKDERSVSIGTYLNELMIPVMALLDQKQSVVYFSPNGKPPVFDPASDNVKSFGGDKKKYQRAKELSRELKPSSFAELERFSTQNIAGVLVPGGHAPLIDIANDKQLGEFLRRTHDANLPTGMICHGPIASISAIADPEAYLAALKSGDIKKAEGFSRGWIYAGYKITIFSTAEEKIAEERKLGGMVQYYPDDALKIAGANVVVKAPGKSNVVVDRELITGQNPNSAEEFATTFAGMVSRKAAAKVTPMKARTFMTNDGEKLSYSAGGNEQGPPIVLIHGFPFSSAMWKSQVEVLKRDFRVVTYDMRGFGKSQTKHGPFTMELLVDDLIQLLDHEKISKATVVGFSMGGFLTLRAIERNPARFRALVLANTRSAADSNESKVRRTDALKTIKSKGLAAFADGFLKSAVSPATLQGKPELMKTLKGMVTTTNTVSGVSEGLFALMSRTDTTESLSLIKVPTLILVGLDDAVTPIANAKVLHDAIAGSKMEVIPEAGHMSPIENPEAFNQNLMRFLKSLK